MFLLSFRPSFLSPSRDQRDGVERGMWIRPRAGTDGGENGENVDARDQAVI